jgi:16S rRNA (cytidine1402-2'-O)-methyltransferase
MLLLSNKDIVLVSDAGTPLISDPGYKLVALARKMGVNVVTIPGACAVTASLSVSGLPTDKFKFWGFLPKNKPLDNINFEPNMTQIIYESPNRVQKTIQEIFLKYPDCSIAVCSELTKIHEKIIELNRLDNLDLLPRKGEYTLVIRT